MRAPWWLARRVFASQCMLSTLTSTKARVHERLHPAIKDFTVELAKTQPCFSLPPRNIRILGQPNEFLDLLLDMVRRARTRVFLSSLYIGTEEKYLVDALEDALRLNPDLHVYLHLDYNRSTRPGPSSTASMLLPLLQAYPDRVHTYLFRSPKLKGLVAKLVPRRFDEGWGTWHAKVYGADDEVLISGANLNDSYFTNRQDRYLHFKSTPFSDYCFSFLKMVAPFCYKLEATSDGAYDLKWSDKATAHDRIESKAGKAFRSLQDEHLHTTTPELTTEVNALIFPIIQAGQFNIREEERTMDLLFKHLNAYARSSGSNPLMDLTSGYFSLSKAYQRLLCDSTTDCRVLCASPEANGFLGSSGISGRIPEGYTHLEQRFWRGILRSGRQWPQDASHGVQLHEWGRSGWTYHAKGIWVSPSPSEDPVLTLFGSTNLNSRSANLDTELAFVMVVPSDGDSDAKDLRKKLGEEVRHLREYAAPWKGDERKVRIGTKAIVGLVGGML